MVNFSSRTVSRSYMEGSEVIIAHTSPLLRTPPVVARPQAKNWGRIINVASCHGLVASIHKAGYVASKHGLVGLTKVVALENATTGVTANAICPGWVLTPLVQKQVWCICVSPLCCACMQWSMGFLFPPCQLSFVALENATTGVTAAICPGWVLTPLVQKQVWCGCVVLCAVHVCYTAYDIAPAVPAVCPCTREHERWGQGQLDMYPWVGADSAGAEANLARVCCPLCLACM